MPTTKTSPRTKTGATIDTVRTLALALAGVEEGTSYGTPAWKAKGKLFARLREDGETLVVRVEPDARDLLMRSEPGTFFVTDHYVGHPWVLVALPKVQRGALAALLEEAWRLVAPAKTVSGAAKAPAAAKPAAKKARPAARPAPKHTVATHHSGGAAKALVRVRAICLALEGAEERVSHGAPTFFARGKTFAMFADNHHGDGRVALWCKAPPGAQQELVAVDARRFFVPPYVGPSGWVGVRLDLDPDWAVVEACVKEGYGMLAQKRGVRPIREAAAATRARTGSSRPRRA